MGSSCKLRAGEKSQWPGKRDGWSLGSLRLLPPLKCQEYVMSLDLLRVRNFLLIVWSILHTIPLPISACHRARVTFAYIQGPSVRRCVCAVICSFSASIHLPGPQALEVRKSRPHPVLETVTQGEEAELSRWRREWPQIIPSFPSIPHSHGGCNAKGEIPREWKVGDTDRAIYPIRVKQGWALREHQK